MRTAATIKKDIEEAELKLVNLKAQCDKAGVD
jgi:hypothetical protein